MKNTFLSLVILAVFSFTNTLVAQELFQTPELTFSEIVHDFGNIKEIDGAATCTFEFTNTSKAPITAVSVKASCGCTTPDWSKEPVTPGKKGYVNATYDPKKRPGKFSKTITVTTNTGKRTVLTIKGVVEPKPVEAPSAQ